MAEERFVLKLITRSTFKEFVLLCFIIVELDVEEKDALKLLFREDMRKTRENDARRLLCNKKRKSIVQEVTKWLK